MEITEIQKTVSKKRQFEQYEPFQASATVTASVTDGDDPEEVGDRLYELAKAQVDQDILKRKAELDVDESLIGRVLGDEDD
jgi:hypothetical protein